MVWFFWLFFSGFFSLIGLSVCLLIFSGNIPYETFDYEVFRKVVTIVFRIVFLLENASK